MTVAYLLHRTGHDRLDEVSVRDITRFLRSRGLRVSPSLFSVLAEQGEENCEPSAFDSPVLAVEAPRLEGTTVTVSPTRLPALGSAIGVGLVAVCIGVYSWPPYGVTALVAAIAATGVVWLSPASLDRRLPPTLSKGGLLGTAVAATFISIALIVFVVLRSVFSL